MRALLLLFAAALSLTGCLAPPKDAPYVEDASGPATGNVPMHEEPLAAAALPASAPARGDAGAPAASDPPVASSATASPHRGHTRVDAVNASSSSEIGAPEGLRAGSGGAEAILHVDEASPVRARLLVTWDAATPLATDLDVVFARDGNIVAHALGPSPMLIDLPIDSVRDVGRYHATASPDSPGALSGEIVHFELTLDYC